MNRAQALVFFNTNGFDALMVDIGRLIGDTTSGYGPVLDRAFTVYAVVNGLAIAPTTTVVPSDEEYGFGYLLEALAYDVVLRGYARMVDTSVDAPLTSAKFSQAYRQLRELRDLAWANAAGFGYGDGSNVGLFGVNLDFLEANELAYEWA